MIKSFINGKVAVYIDASNMFYSQRTLKWNIDYKKLINYLKQECTIINATIYFGKKLNDQKQEKFLKKLISFGYIVKTRQVKYIKTKDGSSKMKGNLDAEMIVDMITQKDTYDSLLLFSGDSDFGVVRDYIKSQKKRVLVASVKGHVAKELLEKAKFINLKQLKDKISR